MKQLFIQTGIGLLLLLTACHNEVVPEDRGEQVTLSFDLYKAELTKAENATLMPAGKKFYAYAYEQGSTTDQVPVGSGIYTVDNKGTATGNLTLYRGVYNIYLVSYYDDYYVPELGDNYLITVSNEKDFMHTALKNVTVQPTPGENKMSVPLTDPFSRLCSNVIVSVKASNTQPVTVMWLTVKNITIDNLSAPLSYQLGTDNLLTSSALYTESLSFNGDEFGSTDKEAKVPKVSNPKVVLPINGATALKFNISLEIQYNRTGEQGASVTEPFNYEASVRKIFLPGMTYVFDFTLTFFGALNPADLTLGILEYTTVSDNTDNVGE